MIKEYVPRLVEKYDIDFVIANGENASHGKGLLRHHYDELIQAGVDVITLGNHYDSKKELRHYIDRVDSLIRPANLIGNYPGEGSIVYDVDGVYIRVTNILGSAFINENVDAPYKKMLDIIEEDQSTVIHIVDFHAEATGEKQCLASVLDGKVTAILGTHTHVQTNDAHILKNGTAFISDVGMTGYADGVLGCTAESVVPKICWGEDRYFETPDEGRGVLSAVVIEADELSGEATKITPIYILEEKDED